MTEPKFFTKNWITGDDIFTVSHASDLIQKIYDRDNASQWISAGANDDATQISIEIEFYEGLDAVNRDVDTVFISNHNLKDITVQYWTGAVYATFGSASTITDDFTKITGTLRNTAKIKILATETQVADEEKAIGELLACALSLDVGSDLKAYDPGAREMVSRNQLGDGSLHQVFTKFSPNRTQKYEARCRFQFLTLEKLETLLSLKEAGDEVLWQPESVNRPDQIFLVHFYGPVRSPFSQPDFKGSGYTVELDLREV